MKERELVLRHVPILRLDQREPFLPYKVAATVFRVPGRSPSCSRMVEIPKEADYTIEYDIWWDWDIQHLYELERVWCSVTDDGDVIAMEGSWHRRFRRFTTWRMEDTHPVLFCQPGKHAIASDPQHFPRLITVLACTLGAGAEGLLIASKFADVLPPRSRHVNRLIRKFLRKRAFFPSFQFEKEVRFNAKDIVSWDELSRFIPKRIESIISSLTTAQ